MSWFRKKGKYWYFVERVDGKEQQHYIGDDERVKEIINTGSFDEVHKAIEELWRVLWPDKAMTAVTLEKAVNEIKKEVEFLIKGG